MCVDRQPASERVRYGFVPVPFPFPDLPLSAALYEGLLGPTSRRTGCEGAESRRGGKSRSGRLYLS